MKKNYLLFALLGTLVLGGCKNDNNTTSSSSAATTSAVAKAVSHISENYTINYSLTDSEGGEWNYSNKLERVKSLQGAVGNLAYYSEYSEIGYYITETEGYQFYLNGYERPVYNTNGKLSEEDIASFEILVDLNGNFSNATWELDTSKDGVEEYFTNDSLAIATASFLTDYLSEEDPVAFVKAIVKDEKLSGFTTYNADGIIITEAEIKRIGGSMAIDYVPYLDDSFDKYLVNKWLITTEYENNIGGYFSAFEINSEGELVVYNMDEVSGAYIKSTDTYTYSEPDGTGFYKFEKEGSDDYAELRVLGGDVLFYTYDSETETMGVGIAYGYYKTWIELAVNYLNYYYSETHTYYMEELTTSDQNYGTFVSAANASSGYYIYANTFDEITGEEITEYMIILLEYPTKGDLVENFFEGDSKFANGYAMSGYAFGNFVLGGYANAESMYYLFMPLISLVPTEFYDFDMSKYPNITEGQSALEYLISYMESEGYSYVNKETADPDFVVNETVDATTGEVLEEGTNFYNEIYDIIKTYTNYTDNQGNVLFNAEDYYIFYKEEVDPTTGEKYYSYSGVMVCDRNMEDFVGGYDDLLLFGYGYFGTAGDIYESLTTWLASK